MVGLHTCGDLAPSTLRIFTSKAEVKAVCSVGCCYHLLSEEFENQHKDSKYCTSHDFHRFQLSGLFSISLVIITVTRLLCFVWFLNGSISGDI